MAVYVGAVYNSTFLTQPRTCGCKPHLRFQPLEFPLRHLTFGELSRAAAYVRKFYVGCNHLSVTFRKRFFKNHTNHNQEGNGNFMKKWLKWRMSHGVGSLLMVLVLVATSCVQPAARVNTDVAQADAPRAAGLV